MVGYTVYIRGQTLLVYKLPLLAQIQRVFQIYACSMSWKKCSDLQAVLKFGIHGNDSMHTCTLHSQMFVSDMARSIHNAIVEWFSACNGHDSAYKNSSAWFWICTTFFYLQDQDKIWHVDVDVKWKKSWKNQSLITVQWHAKKLDILSIHFIKVLLA